MVPFTGFSVYAVEGVLPRGDEEGLMEKATKLGASITGGVGAPAKLLNGRMSARPSNVIDLPSFMQILIEMWSIAKNDTQEKLRRLFKCVLARARFNTF